MKKQRLFSVAVLIMLFALAPVNAQVEYPTSHDFGAVNVGESPSTIVTLTNNTFSMLEINSITLTGSGYFSYTSSKTPTFVLGYSEYVDILVTFKPTSVGEFTADLVIKNGDAFIVLFLGTGVPAHSSTIVNIIDFINLSVSNETLEGAGSGNSADGRLNALINMLNRASYLIGIGDYEAACNQLSAALQRCNDFVQGVAQAELEQMISDLMNILGCR